MQKIIEYFCQHAGSRRKLHTHTHTHTCNPCQIIKQIGTICLILISIIISPTFATEINNPATCDSGTLSTDTGPTNLRANYESNTLNLKWYDDDYNRINVSSTSSDSCTYGGTINLPTPPTKKGYTFKGWKVITYTPVEYIETNGTDNPQIDTGVHGDNNNLSIVTEFMILQKPSSVIPSIFTNWAFTGNNAWMFAVDPVGRCYTTANTYDVLSTPLDCSNSKYTFELDYNGYTLNNVRHSHSSRVTPGTTNDATIKIYGSTNSMRSRIYSFKIYDNGTLIRDMIPVKDSNGVVCMYDEVSKQYFYNAGTGAYIAGPDL